MMLSNKTKASKNARGGSSKSVPARLGLDILFTFMLNMHSRLYVFFAFMVIERSNDMLIIFSLLYL